MTQTLTGGQYSLFRGLFGLYLCIHFAHLLPWGAELFANSGVISNADASPLFGIIPNILALNDGSMMVLALLASAMLSAVAFMIGYRDKWAAAWILYVLICIFARDPLIANPSLPFVGWMLLAHLFVPSKPFGSFDARNDLALAKQWCFPRHIYLAAVMVLALSYSYSGYTKLLSPSWVSGDGIAYVLQNPLAREHILSDLLQLSPALLKLLTWFILYVELIYVFLILSRKIHLWAWTMMLLVQFGFLVFLNFADLTSAMLLMHMLTFDPRWLKAKAATQGEVVYYDGECGFCHGFIKLLLSEDRTAHFQYSQLGGEHFNKHIDAGKRETLPTSVVVYTADGSFKVKSDAVVHCLKALGGFWGVIGHALALLPTCILNGVYDLVGRIRYGLAKRTKTVCPIVHPSLSIRFI